MQTSYFAKSYNHPNAVSISRKPASWFEGREYKKLAPPMWLVMRTKLDKEYDFYIFEYTRTVLDKLDPKQVFEELGKDSVLLCHEGKGKFCHRHIVAKWLEKNLKIKIEEIQ